LVATCDTAVFAAPLKTHQYKTEDKKDGEREEEDDRRREERNKTTANKWLTANISWLLRPAIRIPGFLRAAAAAETPPYDVNALFIAAFMCAVEAMSVYNDTLWRRNTYVLATVSCKGPSGLGAPVDSDSSGY